MENNCNSSGNENKYCHCNVNIEINPKTSPKTTSAIIHMEEKYTSERSNVGKHLSNENLNVGDMKAV